MHKENKANFVAIYRWKPAIIFKEKKRNIRVYGCGWSLEFVGVKMNSFSFFNDVFFYLDIGSSSFIFVIYFLSTGGDTCTSSFWSIPWLCLRTNGLLQYREYTGKGFEG